MPILLIVKVIYISDRRYITNTSNKIPADLRLVNSKEHLHLSNTCISVEILLMKGMLAQY